MSDWNDFLVDTNKTLFWRNQLFAIEGLFA